MEVLLAKGSRDTGGREEKKLTKNVLIKPKQLVKGGSGGTRNRAPGHFKGTERKGV